MSNYMVSGYEPEGRANSVVFTFVPQAPQPAKGAAIRPRIPQFIAIVTPTHDGLSIDWSNTPDGPGADQTEIEDDIRTRMQERAAWIDRVNDLISHVEQWARNLGWRTRRVEKKLDDARVGSHRVPALLMQTGTVEVILEPIGRSGHRTEGIVDLYLMPRYDDIASIYYYDDRWNLHYVSQGDVAAAAIREAESVPLSEESLGRVLAEMTQHAV